MCPSGYRFAVIIGKKKKHEVCQIQHSVSKVEQNIEI